MFLVFIFPYWDGILKKLRHNYLNKRKGNKKKKKVEIWSPFTYCSLFRAKVVEDHKMMQEYVKNLVRLPKTSGDFLWLCVFDMSCTSIE